MEQIEELKAKTHLLELLNRVFEGEKFIITKDGIPVAVISPYRKRNKLASSETIQKLKEFRKNKKLGDLELKDLLETGRD